MTAPLTPKNCDLRDFEFMSLDVRRLLRSDTWLEAASDPRLGHASMTLWAECWHQVPAGSLPDNDRVLARLAMCDPAEWERIRDRALSGWIKCDDGRLYHPVVAEKAVQAFERKGEFREANLNRSERQKRWRDRSRDICAQLRSFGITPPGGAKLATLEGMLEEALRDRDATVDANVDASSGRPSVSETHRTVDIRYISEADASGVPAPASPAAVTALPDWRDRLFRQGLASVRQLTGKPEAAARSLIGRWLRDAKDDARKVLRTIEDAQEQNAAEPVAWIEAALKARPAQRSDSLAFTRA